MLLDDVLPEYEISEVHSVRIAAPPGVVLEAVKRATPGEMPLVRLLFAIRSSPARFAGEQGLPGDKTGSLYEQMARRFVPLAEDPGREEVAGGIGQMWKLTGGVSPEFRDARGFVEFGRPGYELLRRVPGRRRHRAPYRDPRLDHRSRLASGFRALLAVDTTRQRGHPAELAGGGQAPGRARRP